MARTETEVRGQGATALRPAGFTYIDLSENYVYYAANHNQGVENIPGIPEIALSEAQQAAAGRKNRIFINLNKTLFSWLAIGRLTSRLMTYIIAKLHAVESQVSKSELVDRNMPPLQSTRSLTSILSFFSTKSWWATETKHSLNICCTPAHQ